MSTWFYAKGGQTHGPISEGDFRNLINLGTVSPDDLVWKEGMSAWQTASTIPGLVFPPPGRVPPPPVPSSEPSTPVVSATSLPPAPSPAIPDYLPWSIAATLLCCLPAGIAAIYYSVKANSARTTGNLEIARHQAQIARKWLIAAVAIGIVFTIIYLIIIVLGGIHAAQQQ
jgi:Interferon-induced transmembrane protein/GYF domain 2